MGQKQTSDVDYRESALAPKADVTSREGRRLALDVNALRVNDPHASDEGPDNEFPKSLRNSLFPNWFFPVCLWQIPCFLA